MPGAGRSRSGVVMEEMGRALLCAPFLSSAVLATTALLRCADEDARKRLLPGLASGELVGTLALTEDSARWDARASALTARESDGSWRLTGHKSFVLDGATADARPHRRPHRRRHRRLFAVDGDAAGADPRRRCPRWTRPAGRPGSSYRDVPATRLRSHGDGWDTGRRRCSTGPPSRWPPSRSAVAARALDMAVGVRQGAPPVRPAHRLLPGHQAPAAPTCCWRSSRPAPPRTTRCCAADGRGPGELPAVASLAKAFCSDACVQAAAENIQVHGGIGFTWEHPAHLYFKRAKTSQLLFGDPAYHRELLARRIGMSTGEGAA